MDPLNRREIAHLDAVAAGGSLTERRRARLILLADQGLRPAEIAQQVNLSRRRVYHWLRQFRLRRMSIFQPGVPARVEPAAVETAVPAAPSPWTNWRLSMGWTRSAAGG